MQDCRSVVVRAAETAMRKPRMLCLTTYKCTKSEMLVQHNWVERVNKCFRRKTSFRKIRAW